MFFGYALAVTVIEGESGGRRGFVALKEFRSKEEPKEPGAVPSKTDPARKKDARGDVYPAPAPKK